MTRAVASLREVDESLGIHLTRVAGDAPAQIDDLADRCGGRVGLLGILGRLDRPARRSRIGRAFGRDVHEAFAWNRWDGLDPFWWPQGISGSADASADGRVEGRRLLSVAWYSRTGKGCRVTFVDLERLRYQHVLVVHPTLEPVNIHAGGMVWCGRSLHLAATARGIVTCNLDDIIIHPHLGPILPASATYRGGTEPGHDRMRYSFLSLDRFGTPPTLVAGEYRHSAGTGRLLRYEIDSDTGLLVAGADRRSRPLDLETGTPEQMQGALVAHGTHFVSTSRGQVTRGSMFVGGPGRFREHPRAMPMGPEDLTYEASEDLLWSLSEHPGRRWFYSMRRSSFE